MPEDTSGLFARRTIRDRPRREGVFRVLLLAGTGEARQIAAALTRESRLVATASLARPDRRPMPLGIPTRIGGWGGRDAFADWLRQKRIHGIIDATHPFANGISHRTADVAADLGIDYLQVLRPAWRPEPGDRWLFLNAEDEAANHIPEDATVFLATGRKELERFGNLAPRRIYCRLLGTPLEPFPFENGAYLVNRPPFSVRDEIALFEALGIDWLVVRNSGGGGSTAKLEAARALGLRVAMLRRPPQPEAVRAETVSEVLAWVRRRL